MSDSARPLALDAIAPFWMLTALTYVFWQFAIGNAALASGWMRAATLLALLAALLYGALRASTGPPWAALFAAAAGSLSLPTLLAAVIAPGAHLSGGVGLVPWQWVSTIVPNAVADPSWALVHTPDNLVASWLGRVSAGGPARRFLLENGLYVGVLPAWLALLGLFTARGLVSWVGRACLLAAIALLSGALAPPGAAAALVDVAPCLLAVGVALLAGLALGALLGERPAPGHVGPSMALAAVAVTLTVTLAITALQAGSAHDAELLSHAAQLLGAPTAASPIDVVLAQQNASQLRAVLDRAALASFAALCALLVLLQERGPRGALLVVLVTTVDLARLDAAWLGR